MKQALLQWYVQFSAFVIVFVILGCAAIIWEPLRWITLVVLIGPFVAWMFLFLLLAGLTSMPYSDKPPILVVRLRQLIKGIWGALMLVLSALLGASMSADLIAYGTHNFRGFLTNIFMPGYFSLVIGLAVWGGLFIYLMLTATDLIIAREPKRTEARHRALDHLVEQLTENRTREWPYSIQLLESVWKHLTGGPLQLATIGYLSMPLLLVFAGFTGLI